MTRAGGLIVPGRRSAVPTAPWEIREEVELYARESGRSATMQFIPTQFVGNRPVAGTWKVSFSLRNHDRRLQAVQQGRTDETPTEDVWLHTLNPDGRTYAPLDIHQMGASGVRQFLEKGNTWSGRGQFRSVEDAFSKAREHNAEASEKRRAFQKEESRVEQRSKRRQRLGIPVVQGADLGT